MSINVGDIYIRKCGQNTYDTVILDINFGIIDYYIINDSTKRLYRLAATIFLDYFEPQPADISPLFEDFDL